VVLVDPKTYATISPKILKRLDPITQLQFLTALDKGVVAQAEGVNGIKQIGDDDYELKIHADIRLLATTYKNPDGVSVLVFDTATNHKGVKKSAREIVKEVGSITITQIIAPTEESDAKKFKPSGSSPGVDECKEADKFKDDLGGGYQHEYLESAGGGGVIHDDLMPN